VWRRIAARAEALQDHVLREEARRMVRALVILVGPADPAAAPPNDHGLRKVAATISKKGG